ncbi:MAG: hypothetical protein R3C03_20690 [Pirellulaceae bacterium]
MAAVARVIARAVATPAAAVMVDVFLACFQTCIRVDTVADCSNAITATSMRVLRSKAASATQFPTVVGATAV